MAPVEVLGVDGARGGWVAVRLADGGFADARFFRNFEDAELPSGLESADRVGALDLIDAAAAAWSAWRIARDEARSLPEPPETAADGRPVAIWY
jgi:predicted RNase H-like nuclease